MPMAISDYRPGTRAQLDNRIANKKTQRSFVQQDFKDLVEHTKTNGTYTEVITANAFDKEVLEGAREMRLNSVIDGTDNWNNVAPSAAPVKAKATKKKLEGEDLPPLNRLGDEYDTPIPLQD
jgi:hypothetical protein